MEQSEFIPHIHCETGTLRNLLAYVGYDISEAMIFGIGKGMIFGFSTLVWFSGINFMVCRTWQGFIIRNFIKQMDLPIQYRRYFLLNKKKAMRDLDALLGKNIPVGLMTSISRLPFIREESNRFFFNGHSVQVMRKEGGNYVVVDNFSPADEYKLIAEADLRHARFSLKIPPIWGDYYYIERLPDHVRPIESVITDSIRSTCKVMLAKFPFSFMGVSGMRYMAYRIKRKAKPVLTAHNRKFFLYIFRMLEIGSGGSGYRYLYARFLEEAGKTLHSDELCQMAEEMVNIGDQWRRISIIAGKLARDGAADCVPSVNEIVEIVYEIADMEERLFRKLRVIVDEIDQKNNHK